MDQVRTKLVEISASKMPLSQPIITFYPNSIPHPGGSRLSTLAFPGLNPPSRHQFYTERRLTMSITTVIRFLKALNIIGTAFSYILYHIRVQLPRKHCKKYDAIVMNKPAKIAAMLRRPYRHATGDYSDLLGDYGKRPVFFMKAWYFYYQYELGVYLCDISIDYGPRFLLHIGNWLVYHYVIYYLPYFEEPEELEDELG